MTHVVLTTAISREDIAGLRGKAADSFEAAVEALRAKGCEAGGYRLTGYEVPWICCVHLYADWRMLIRLGNDDRVHIVAVGRHIDGSPEDIYRRLMELTGIEPPAEVERTKPPCCGKPAEMVENHDQVDEFIDAAKAIFHPDLELNKFLSGNREFDERIRRARRR